MCKNFFLLIRIFNMIYYTARRIGNLVGGKLQHYKMYHTQFIYIYYNIQLSFEHHVSETIALLNFDSTHRH